MAAEGNRAELSLRVTENSDTVITVRRRPRPFQEEPEPLLVTIPELEYCGLVTELEMTAVGMRTSFAFDAKKPYRYDFCMWNPEEDRMEFYYDEQPVGWIVCDEYRILRKEA